MKHAGDISSARVLHSLTRAEQSARAIRFRLAELHSLAELLTQELGGLMHDEKELEAEIAAAKQTVVDALAAKDAAITAQTETITSLTTLVDQLKAQHEADGSIDTDALFSGIQGIIDAAKPATTTTDGTASTASTADSKPAGWTGDASGS